MKQIVQPGSFPCVIAVEGGGGEVRELAAEIELRGDGSRQYGTLYGDVPIKSENGVSRFPQNYWYRTLKGRLRTNHDLWLFDVSITTWFDDQAFLSAGTALVGFPSREGDIPFVGARFQVTHLDRTMEFTPIAETTFPASTDGPLEWWVRERDSRYHEWIGPAGESLTVGFDTSARIGDPYEMNIRYAPAGEIHLSAATTLDDLVSKWFEPIRGILAVATGKPVRFTHVELLAAGNGGDRGRLQLFSSWVSQDPYLSAPRGSKDIKSAVLVGPNSENLLTLVLYWRQRADQRSPIFETYTSLAGVAGEHPRHRFLLLVQALEGHYGYVHAEKFANDREKYETARLSHIEKLRDSGIPAETVKFIKKNLRGRVDPQLSAALKWALARVPDEMEDRLSKSAIIKKKIAEDETVINWRDAIRVIRNDLAHGTKGYDPNSLQEVVQVLELVVRAHVLLDLGVSDVGFVVGEH